MSATPKTSYGPWSALDVLGQGGNAVVWRAEGPSGEHVALKVINETRGDREAYARFIREVEFLRGLGPQPGVLPLIDSHLPEKPSRSDRAWLAMPIANPIDSVLDDSASLQDVVAAVASIANTLACLQRDHGLGHRDIKPGNLYELNGEWLVGDFGLISVPDAESLTGNGRQVGPAHFTSYEMILDPEHADPHPADVYSLAKTLWVLATGQRFAPLGHQRADAGPSVGEWRPHRRAAELDHEIELMTQDHPQRRPSMEQVAADLTAWQALAQEEPELDLAGAGARMRARIGQTMAAQDEMERLRELAIGASQTLQELLRPLNNELTREFPRTQTNLAGDELTKNTLRVYVPGRGAIWEWRRCTLVSPLEGPNALQLRMSRVLQLFDDGALYLLMMVLVAPARSLGGTVFNWQPTGQRSARVGSVEATKLLEDSVAELVPQLAGAVEAMVEAMPDEGTLG